MSLVDCLNRKFKGGGYPYWFAREWFVVLRSYLYRFFDKKIAKQKKSILFYHNNSLGYAGTEKFLQILAKYLSKAKYNVYFLYPEKSAEASGTTHPRLEYLRKAGIITIPFVYDKMINRPPYYVSGMNPDLFDLIAGLDIDLFITAGSGHADYPFSIIKKIPIILLNIFGQSNIQKNIQYHLCISQEVADKLKSIVPDEKIKVFGVPSESPGVGSLEAGLALRQKLGIKESDVIFGRIGRPDDNIFDPIGIRAFQKVVRDFPEAHYLIMAPPPILEKIVAEEKIPNVHFLPPSSNENEVWAFHQALDVMAHFRNDGESFGLNIVESMLCANPIITHRSHIWNAHLEYLDDTFSRVVIKDNVDEYASYMCEFVSKKRDGSLESMGKLAKATADKLFLIQNNIGKFEQWVDESMK